MSASRRALAADAGTAWPGLAAGVAREKEAVFAALGSPARTTRRCSPRWRSTRSS
ncbi:MAG: hypothetical protein WDM81_01375 [Rhizomicrobium sp.]